MNFSLYLNVGPRDGQNGGRAIRCRADNDVVLDRLASNSNDGVRGKEWSQMGLDCHRTNTWNKVEK